MSVLDRLKSLISGTKKDMYKSLSNEATQKKSEEFIEVDSKQTLSEEKIAKSDSEINSKEELSKVEVPATEEEIIPVVAEVEPKLEDKTEKIGVEEISLENEEDLDDISDGADASEEDSEKNEKSDNMTLLKENDIYSMDDIDKEFTQKFIDAGLETVDHCFQCGTCGGGCPSGRRTPYRVRQIVRKCLLGLKEEVISDPALWMCTTCYTCQERCPRSVQIVGIIKMARNVAAQAGYMADAHKATGSFVIKSGHGVPINDKTKALRKDIGLAEVPPTTHAFPEALKEVQDICAACGFDKLIGFNMETGELE